MIHLKSMEPTGKGLGQSHPNKKIRSNANSSNPATRGVEAKQKDQGSRNSEDALFVGLDVPNLTAVSTFPCGATPFKRGLGFGGIGCVAASNGLSRSTLLLLALLAPFFVLLESFFLFLDPASKERWLAGRHSSECKKNGN